MLDVKCTYVVGSDPYFLKNWYIILTQGLPVHECAVTSDTLEQPT